MAMNEMDRNALTPEQRDARLALDVERLLRFGRKHKLIKDLDVLVARNTLLDLLALQAPSDSKPPKENPETPAALLDEMVELASQKDLFDGTVPQYRINFETRLMGALMPRESEVCKKFKKLYERKGAKAATDWFYDLCVVSNYIRTAQIAKNIQWNSASPYGDLEITINLTKPEKDPKTIALERLPTASYPTRWPASTSTCSTAPTPTFMSTASCSTRPTSPWRWTVRRWRRFLTLSPSSPTTPAAPTPTCPSWAAAS